MIKHIIGAVAIAFLSACTTSDGGSGNTTMAAAPVEDRAAFVGTWTGSLQSGASVRVVVPERGNATYAFRGEMVPVSSTRVSGGTMSIRIRQATVTMTPSGNQMNYQYQHGTERATTTLSRS